MSRQIHVLIVDDSKSDVDLMLYAFKKTNRIESFDVVYDGETALKFLRKQEPYQCARTPDLILLDINLPKINGIEVLKQIRSDERIQHIPICILSTSSQVTDVLSAYKAYVNAYLVKPINVEDFIKTVSVLESFFFELVKLPTAVEDEVN